MLEPLPPPPASRSSRWTPYPVRPPAPPLAPVRKRGVAVVVLFAALLGAVVGAATIAVLDRDSGAPAVPTAQVLAPIVAGADASLDRVAAVAAAVLPSVVQIDRDGEQLFADGNGSGVVYRSDGYLVTSNHVVAGADEVTVVFADRSRSEAEIVGTDERTDLAVLRVNRSGLPAIQVADGDGLRVGELAVALGSPFGLHGSVTAGVISALDRPITVTTPDGDPLPLPNVVQTDAPINPGNSGGPLVDAEGRLIGINSAILTSGQPANAGVGFAIPAATVVDIADELIANGFVRHAFLGIAGSTLNPEAAERLGADHGAVIEEVRDGTPADEAGLRVGDLVVAVDGETVTSMEDLVIAIRGAEVGGSLEITYLRDREEQTVSVTLAELPED